MNNTSEAAFLDKLRQMILNVDELRDHSLPGPVNMMRLANGDVTRELHKRQQQSQGPLAGIRRRRNMTATPGSASINDSNDAFNTMSQTISDFDELWDPTLPDDVNFTRMLRDGLVPQAQRRHHEDATHPLEALSRLRLGRGLGSHDSAPSNTPGGLVERAPTGASAGKGTHEIEDIVHSLRMPATDKLPSPVQALQGQALNVFQYGPLRAGGIFASLTAAAESSEMRVKTPQDDMPIPWNSYKAAATLVGLLACPQDRLYEVVKFQSQRLGGLPTLNMIRNTPTSSLQTAFRNAKSLARGDKAISSVIVVSLIDVHIFELARQERSEPYTSYAHTFVLGIGSVGVAIWQGWGEHGYGLDQWISGGGARIRTWQEAGDFGDVFEKFATYKVTMIIPGTALYVRRC